MVIKYPTYACYDEEGKTLVKSKTSYLCIRKSKNILKASKFIGNQDEKSVDHEPIVRNQGTDEIVNSEEPVRTVHMMNQNVIPHLSNNLKEGVDHTTQTRESPKNEPDSLLETDERANYTDDCPMLQ